MVAAMRRLQKRAAHISLGGSKLKCLTDFHNIALYFNTLVIIINVRMLFKFMAKNELQLLLIVIYCSHDGSLPDGRRGTHVIALLIHMRK